jgi:hypothetical protein
MPVGCLHGHTLGTRLLIRLFRMQEKTESNSTFLTLGGGGYMNPFNADNFLLLYV